MNTIKSKIKKTQINYGFLWTRIKDVSPVAEWHFNRMQEVIDEPIVRGQIGIDIGSGCGYDTYIMAKQNSSVKIISIDISDGILVNKELISQLRNVKIIKCSILNAPLKDKIFDFAYSFGVLHHTESPKKGLLEIARILKKNSPVFLYLYEDHSENIIKYLTIKMIDQIRYLTVKMHPKVIYALSCLVSPFVYIVFSLPARILKKIKFTKNFVTNIPFNFGTGFFSLQGDLYDRFSAPIEHRFSRKEAYAMLSECGFSKIKIKRLENSAGWVIWGYKE